jgi:hypothetical protein
MPATWQPRYLAWLIGILFIVLGVLGLLHVVPFTETIFWGVMLVLGIALFF